MKERGVEKRQGERMREGVGVEEERKEVRNDERRKDTRYVPFYTPGNGCAWNRQRKAWTKGV